MKQVPRLKCSPDGLESHCSLKGSAGLDPSMATAVWREFRDQAPQAYANSPSALVRAQQGLCCYCEQRLTDRKNGDLVPSDYQIEHVRAKTGGAGRTLDWTNFMLACCGGSNPHSKDESRRYSGRADLSCGQRKDDEELPLGTDPRDFPWRERLVEVDANGELTANKSACIAASIEVEALQHCIDVTLNLNADRLCLRRIEVIDELDDALKSYQQILDGNLTEAERELLREYVVKSRLGPDKHGHLNPFWTTERAYIPGADEWVAVNHGLFGFD